MLWRMTVVILLLSLFVACGGTTTPAPEPTDAPTLVPTAVEPTAPPPTDIPEPTDEPEEVEASIETMMRDSGLMVTVQDLGDVVIHSLTAPEQVFANSTHIIESENALVLIDTQFLLPNAMDFRAYAESLGKPIDRVLLTHHHPDHFLGGEAFADLDMYSLTQTSDLIAEVGQAEVDEKQADFGAAIASSFVVPQVIDPGKMEIDGVTYEFILVENAEAEFQLVTRLPDYDVVSVGDIVYSGVHLIMAGQPPTWIEALSTLKSESTDSTIVLAGHGLPGGAELYDDNIAWLVKAGELIGTSSTGEEWKNGLVEAFPDLGMTAAMDFVAPFLFPDESSMPSEPVVEAMIRDSGLMVTKQDLGGVTIHSLTAPEQVFANSTHIIESDNALVLIDTQFLLPNAMDFRAYAESLGKPIDRMFLTHHHPDHFLGGEAFADIDMYSLTQTSDLIAEVGQAEVDEKQADFGAAIASSFVVPEVIDPGKMEIDGVIYEFILVENAEAEFQLVTRLPDYDVVSVGDIVYSGVHLIMAGQPPTWIEALNELKAESTENTIVLAGHGLPGGAELYDANIAWLAKAGELIGTSSTGEEWKAGLIEAFPDLGMPAAMDFVVPFLFPPSEEGTNSGLGLLEVITVEMAESATMDTFLPANQVIEEEYASQQPGYIARETAVSDAGLIRLVVHWESKADSDASIAGFGEASGLEAFMANFNAETMAIKQYELKSSTGNQATFPETGAVEVITVRLQDGADPDGFVAANKALEESYITKQPGFIAREIGVSEEGEWTIVLHWESAEDSAASIAKFESAPGVEEFMSFLDTETMAITIFEIQK